MPLTSVTAHSPWPGSALYRKVSFRGRDLEYRRRIFRTDGRRVSHVRQRPGAGGVSPRQSLESASLPAAGTYDAVFCRNVLIYFDRACPGTRDCRARLSSDAGRAAVCRAGRGTGALESRPRVGKDAEGPRLSQRREGHEADAPRPTRSPTLAVPPRRAPAARRITGTNTERPVPAPAQTTASRRPTGSSREGSSRIRGGSSKRRSSAKTTCAGTARQPRCSTSSVSCATPSVTRPMLPPPIARRCTSTRAITKRSCTWRCLMDTQNNRAEAQLLRTRALRVARPGGAS